METYVGENHPKSLGVAWIHHSVFGDISSPYILEIAKNGKYKEVQSANTLQEIKDLAAQIDTKIDTKVAPLIDEVNSATTVATEAATTATEAATAANAAKTAADTATANA